jgi:hypothetical protein
MIKVPFTRSQSDGSKEFSDAINLPDDHGLTDEQIEAMMGERYANWLVIAHPTEEQRAAQEAAALAEAEAFAEMAMDEVVDG